MMKVNDQKTSNQTFKGNYFKFEIFNGRFV